VGLPPSDALLLLFGVFVFGDVKEMLRPRDFHIGMISKAKRHPLSPFVLRHEMRSTEFFRFVLFVSFRQFATSCARTPRPSIAASRRTCPHRSRRRTRVYHTGKRDACGISPRTTRGRWTLAGPPGKSAENQLCGPRVFSRGLRNSLKSLRNKSVLLFWFRWLFSTSSRPPSFSRSEAHPLPAARCLSCSDNRSLPSGLPTVRACRWK
jgi:hypothetical protein